MEKIKQYKFIILVVLIVLGFTFYWYEWRPSTISKQCNAIAVEKTKKSIGASSAEITYNMIYKSCLREKGLQ